MMVRVKFRDQDFTVDGYEFHGDDEHLVELLNVARNPLGPSGASPIPDLELAVEARHLFGIKIIDWDTPKFVEGRVY